MTPKGSREAPLRSRLSHALEFPEDTLGGVSSLSMTGRHSLTLCRCEGVISYDECEVQLRLCDGILRVCGRNLDMRTLSCGVITLAGVIEVLHFEEEPS